MTYSTDHIYDNVAGALSSAYTKVESSAAFPSMPKGATVDADFGQPCLQCKTCPGFTAHPWRKACKWCRCGRTSHRSKEIVERRAKLLGINTTAGIRIGERELARLLELRKYAWTPQGLSAADVEAYFALVPRECVPLIGSPGEVWRQQQLELQMPPWDTDVARCDLPTVEEHTSFRALDDMRIKKVFDIGEVVRCPDIRSCSECHLRSDGTHWAYCSRLELDPLLPYGQAAPPTPAASAGVDSERERIASLARRLPPDERDRSIKAMKRREADADPMPPPPAAPAASKPAKPAEARVPANGRCRGCSDVLYIGELVVSVSRLEGTGQYFHPQCFQCSHCGELLVDLRCCVDVGKEERNNPGAEARVFCGRHWAENHRQRCYACDEIIHQRDHVFEFNKAFHMRHFCCAICDVSLTDSKTFVPLKKKPYCFLCYSEHHAEKCTACECAINPSPGLGGKLTVGDHSWHAACFVCATCEAPLDGAPCVPTPRGLFCKPCYKKARAAGRSAAPAEDN